MNDQGASNLILFEAIARLSRHPRPIERAILAMRTFGEEVISSDKTWEIVKFLEDWDTE